MTRVLALPLAAGVALASCGAPPAPDAALLQPLAGAVPADALRGELRCGWGHGGDTFLLAAADADEESMAEAFVRHDGARLLLMSAVPGGFGRLERDGGSFRGGGIAAEVQAGEAEPTGHEGTRRRATLTVTFGGVTQTLEGWWTCGP